MVSRKSAIRLPSICPGRKGSGSARASFWMDQSGKPLPLQSMRYETPYDLAVDLFRRIFERFLEVSEQYRREDEAKRMNTPHPEE